MSILDFDDRRDPSAFEGAVDFLQILPKRLPLVVYDIILEHPGFDHAEGETMNRYFVLDLM